VLVTLQRTRIKRFFWSEEAFSLVELIIVVSMMALLLGVGALVYEGAARNTDLKATVEMLKQDIRKVYAAVDSGAAVKGSDQLWHKDQYKIEFHFATDNSPANTANSYHILRSKWNASIAAYDAPVVVKANEFAAGHAANAIILNEWIKPSSSSDIIIRDVSGAKSPKEITFLTKGSIVQTDADGDVQIFLRSKSQNKEIAITVSTFGSVE
jgi:type II secretory pathway pseudopilin PulG